jgi:hypothetical protein
MKPGQEKNRELMDFEFSGAKPSYTYPRTKERSHMDITTLFLNGDLET